MTLGRIVAIVRNEPGAGTDGSAGFLSSAPSAHMTKTFLYVGSSRIGAYPCRATALCFGGLRWIFVAASHELMQGDGDFFGMRGAPGNNALQLDEIVSEGADFHQLCFDDLRVPHRTSSMAHVGAGVGRRLRRRGMVIAATATAGSKASGFETSTITWRATRPQLAQPSFFRVRSSLKTRTAWWGCSFARGSAQPPAPASNPK